MGWPDIVVAGFVSVIATGYVIHVNGSRSKEQMVYNLTPRFFLVQAFYEMQSRFPFLFIDVEWSSFYNKLTSVLKAIQVVLGESSEEKKKDTRGIIKRVSIAVDRHLLNYLQGQKQLSELLHEYLPAFGQSWATFLRERDSDARSFPPEIVENYRDEALENMRMLVSSFLYDLQQINSKILNSTRGQTSLGDPNFIPAPARYKKIKVLYATDRFMTEDGEYTGERSKRNGLHYGHMVVGIPDRHLKGVKEFPKKHEEADPLQHMVILSINTELRGDKQGFVSNVSEELCPKTTGDLHPAHNVANEVLLFIHGYNVHHKDAIKTAAQLKVDLKFEGPTIAYSWSSKGNLLYYHHDEQNIKKTVGFLEGFIKTIMNEIPGKLDVHIVAHSMGNQALIQALHNIQKQMPLPSTMRNVVFAAADESRDKFDDMVRTLQENNPCVELQQHDEQEIQGTSHAMSRHAPKFSVYSSMGDRVLFGSMIWHGLRRRLGDTKSFLKTKKQEKGSDLVDVSGRDISHAWLHHSYYSKIPEVLQDISKLLLDNFDAESRSLSQDPLIQLVTYGGKKFYAFRPNEWNQRLQCL